MENKWIDWMILKFTLKKYGVKVGTSLNWLWRDTVNTVMKTLWLLRNRHYLICLVTINFSKNSPHPPAPAELLTDRPCVIRTGRYSKKTAGSHTCIKKPVRYLNAPTQCWVSNFQCNIDSAVTPFPNSQAFNYEITTLCNKIFHLPLQPDPRPFSWCDGFLTVV